MSDIQRRLDALSEAELRLRLSVLIEQCEKEEEAWPALVALRLDNIASGRPSKAYLAVIEIYHLLGLDGGPGYAELEKAIEADERRPS